MKAAIINAVLYLQFPPFIWLFRFLYWLAVKAAVSLVRRVPGVVAIYLSGSFARSEVIFGLSDIDFKIFVRGTKDRVISADIHQRFSRLRYLFPMLGPPDEKGIYFLDDFPGDYHHYPLVHLLFDPEFYANRLIWGDHVIDALPLKGKNDRDIHLISLWRLKDWMDKLGMLYVNTDMCATQKRYLFYKAIGEAARIYLWLREPERPVRERRQALRELMKHVEVQEIDLVMLLLQGRMVFFRREIIALEDCYCLFKKIIGFCLAYLEGQELGIHQTVRQSHRMPDSGGGKEDIAKIAAVAPSDSAIIEYPWLHMPLSPLDCEYFGCPTYVLCTERSLSLAEVGRIADFYRTEMAHRAVIMISDNDRFMYPALSKFMDHWLSSAVTDDLTFTLIRGWADDMPEVLRKRIESRRLAYCSQLEAMIGSEDIHRIDRLLYLKLIFTAVRSLVFYRSLTSGGYVMLSSAAAVIEFLREQTPLSSVFIDSLSEEYAAVQAGKRPFREAFFEKTRRFVEQLVNISKRNASWDELASLNVIDDMQRLSISVVIITRNRSGPLRRCLASLSRLARTPDDLIIVDNGSEDKTRQVVEEFQPPFPIRYVYEPRVGVSVSRNAGVRIARGDVIAFTDDDAIVEPEWLCAIENAFLRDPRIGVVGGRIENLSLSRRDIVYRYFNLSRVDKL